MKFNFSFDKGNYRIDFTLCGKRKRFYPGTKDETTARQIHKQMVYEWETGQFDLSLGDFQERSYRLGWPNENIPFGLSGAEKSETS